jgi:hypothetical protein
MQIRSVGIDLGKTTFQNTVLIRSSFSSLQGECCKPPSDQVLSMRHLLASGSVAEVTATANWLIELFKSIGVIVKWLER